MIRPWTLFALIAVVFCDEDVSTDWASDPVVQLFQRYIQIDTTTAQADFQYVIDFWTELVECEVDATINVNEYTEGYPVIIIKFSGTNSSLPSIMLNSHMDIVSWDETEWTYPPLSAYIDEDGVIWGRGTQDMKSVSIQYFEAMKRIQENDITLLRDVYMTLMPDEELGGQNGMVKFLKSQEFIDMNVGFEMDEGGGFPQPYYLMLHHDKAVWQILVDCYGTSAHGSTFPNRNVSAIGQCINFMDLMYSYRDTQYIIALNTSFLDAGKYTSLNLNRIQGGNFNNILPNHVTMMFDIRLGYDVDTEEFEERLNTYASESGNSINITYLVKDHQSPGTILNDTNPYFEAISEAAEILNITVTPVIPPGSTDGRYVRNMGVPAFGFSPLANTLTLPHMANERMNLTTFIKGIDIYQEIITHLGNIPADETSEDSSIYLIGPVRGVDFA